jgi:hypothetical protein
VRTTSRQRVKVVLTTEADPKEKVFAVGPASVRGLEPEQPPGREGREVLGDL